MRWVGLNRGMRNEEIGKWMCLQNYAHIIISQNNEGGHVEILVSEPNLNLENLIFRGSGSETSRLKRWTSRQVKT